MKTVYGDSIEYLIDTLEVNGTLFYKAYIRGQGAVVLHHTKVIGA